MSTTVRKRSSKLNNLSFSFDTIEFYEYRFQQK